MMLKIRASHFGFFPHSEICSPQTEYQYLYWNVGHQFTPPVTNHNPPSDFNCVKHTKDYNIQNLQKCIT